MLTLITETNTEFFHKSENLDVSYTTDLKSCFTGTKKALTSMPELLNYRVFLVVDPEGVVVCRAQ